jgi:hypothetical protein
VDVNTKNSKHEIKAEEQVNKTCRWKKGKDNQETSPDENERQKNSPIIICWIAFK